MKYAVLMALTALSSGLRGVANHVGSVTSTRSGNSGGQIVTNTQTDTAVLNGNAAPEMAQLHRAAQNDKATRLATDKQADRLMVTQGPTAPSAEEQTKIKTELASMDPAVLQRLADSGTQIHVIGKDDNLFEAGLLRPVPEGQFEQNLNADKAAVKGVYQSNPPIEAPEAKPAAPAESEEKSPSAGGFGGLFGGGFAPADPAAAAFGRAQRERENKIAEGVREATGGRWMEYSPGALSSAENPQFASDPMMAQQQSMMDSMLQRNSSLDRMASAHGFESGTPEAQAFKDRVYSMNQDRIDQSRQEHKARLQDAARGTGEEAANARKTLESFDVNADRLPISIPEGERPLLVPNEFSTTVHSNGKPQKATLTYHDVTTYHDWTGDDGKATKEYMLGQYFSENGRNEVIVRAEQLGKPDDFTLTHELGHAIHRVVERENPDFFRQFEPKLEHSHDTVSPHGHRERPPLTGGAAALLGGGLADTNNDPNREAISSYAETNHREFFAEGYAAYVHDPERLKAMDPELFTLPQQANQTLGGR